jgi:hypothetical protein
MVVVTYPEDQMRVLAVPTVSPVVGEETPRELVIFVLHENPDAASLAGLVAHVLLPDDGQEQRSGRIHDCDVWEEPMAIILLQHLDHAQEEWVLGHGAHGVVGDTGGRCAAHPRGVSEEGIQAAVAALVHVRDGAVTPNGVLTSSRSM